MAVDLGRIDGLIARAEDRVAGQKARIALLEEQSRDTRHAEHLLALLEDALLAFRSTREALASSLRVVEGPGKPG